MRHRIHVPALSELVEVTGEEQHHAVRVVRVREGEEVEVFDGRGRAARGRVESIERDRMTVRTIEPLSARESPLDLTLAAAIIQLEKFELVLQKATELGVRRIVPVASDRCEVRPERYRGKQERWQRIVFEAVKQCGRASIPELASVTSLDEVMKQTGPKVVFDADLAGGGLPPSLPAAVFCIGPEGGFSERELAAAREAGSIFARLGPRRLRAETAAIVACALGGSAYGDLRR